ncbi:membrane protein insertase YidC [Candidatus Entotheonella palauensis]|uniref:membrane protein insertase YidC n=1 Tax=Candidatus Entotheonella palauensis TaxID=93172 RepID=UPI000B7F69CE|nr:membrane protein insertase YidC [Candidatus Entotheonella palauensis]
MEKRTVLAVVMMFVVILLWSILFAPPPPAPPPPGEQVAEESPRPAPEPRVPEAKPAAPEASEPARTAAEIQVDTGVAQLTLSEQGAGVKSVSLLNYHQSLEAGALPVVIAPVPGTDALPLETRLHRQGRTESLKHVTFSAASTSPVRLSEREPEAELKFRGTLADGTVIQRIYRFQHGSYAFEVETQVEGVLPKDGDAMTLLWGPGLLPEEEEPNQRQGQTGTLPRSYIGGKIFEDAPDEVNGELTERGAVEWAAQGNTYFAAILIPQEPVAEAVTVRRVREDALEVGVRTPLAGGSRQVVGVYAGPKSYRLLEAVDPSLGKVIDLGFFSVMARPMLRLLVWVNDWVKNYGITIILVTILIKIVLWPLTQTSYKSMKGMQKLQPKMKELQTLYKDDKQALNRAMMDMYREQKVNPLGGCLPMLLQIPFFFAFYNALLYSIELRHAPFICWNANLFWVGHGICDLSTYDPSYITPLLMGASMFLQQRMMPTTTADPMQAKMMQFMPLIFLFFFLWAPAGLVIYWLVNNVLSIAQQTLINRTGNEETEKAEAVS